MGHLSTTLGPTCQTLRQQYGRRGQWLGYLLATLTVVFIFALQAAQQASFVSAMASISLVLIASQPGSAVARLRNQAPDRLAGIAPAALARQILRAMGERMLIIGPTMAALGTQWPHLNAPWLLGLASFCGLMLAFALWLALLGWHWPARPGLRQASCGVMVALGIASSSLLHLHASLPLPWIAGWLVLGSAMAVGMRTVYQRIQAAAQAA